jgi:trimeric autotransporter adhesin
MALPTTVRNDALNLSTDLAQAGAVFNDATRLTDGGLWSTPADNNNQPAYLGMYTTDINAVSDDIAAMLANPAAMTIGGAAFTPSSTDTATLTEIASQLQTLLAAAPQSVGHSSAEVQAQQTVHAVQTEILNEVAGDPTLAAALNNVQYATGTGANNVGFEALPAGADDPGTLAAAKAPGATLATIGQVFNAANDLAVGGLNHTNLAEFNHDMAAISQGLTNILNDPAQLAQIEAGEAASDAALTTIHLQTVLDQINLQTSKFDGLYATDPNVAARSTNDNLLDIIDIVQNDANLNMAAGGNGNAGTVGGFSEMPAYLNGPDGVNAHGGTITQFQDDQAQTNFWSAFLSEANVINNQLQTVAAGQDTPGEIQQLISQIEAYQKFGADFDKAQGGIFGARFDNELLSGTLLADTQAAVHGLTGIANGDTGPALAADQAQILAAGTGFAADANDVSGNNIPVGGGSYVGTATTVATATSPNGVAMGTIPVTANPDIANGTGAPATTSAGTGTGTGTGNSAAGDPAGPGGSSHSPGHGEPIQVAHAEHFEQHFEHIWHF